MTKGRRGYICAQNSVISYMDLFGSTCICEQMILTMSNAKPKHQSQLTDENLQSVFSISTSCMELDFKAILKDKSQLHGSSLTFCIQC